MTITRPHGIAQGPRQARRLGRPGVHDQEQDPIASRRLKNAASTGKARRAFIVLPDEASELHLQASRHSRRSLSDLRRAHAGRQACGREHYVLPPGAEKDGYGWRLPDGNAIDKEARIAGLFNGVEAEFDLAKTAMKMARALNADAKAAREQARRFALRSCLRVRRAGTHQRSRADLLRADVRFIGAVGDAGRAHRGGGPSGDRLVRPRRGRHRRGEAGGRRPQKRNPAAPQHSPRPLITSGASALRAVEAPPPDDYDGPDDRRRYSILRSETARG